MLVCRFPCLTGRDLARSVTLHESGFHQVKDLTGPEPSTDRYVIRSVARALDVLVVTAESPGGLDVSSVARATNLHSATVFRILQTLKRRGFVVDGSDGTYRVGPRVFEVGNAFLRGASLWRSAADITEHLAERTGETANLGIRDDGDVLYIAIAHGQSEIGIQSVAGGRHPLFCTALGKVLLAHMPWPDARLILEASDIVALTKNTIVRIDRWERELRKVVRQGYGLDDEERAPGVRCLAAPIHDHSGEVVAAVSVSAPAFRLVAEHFDRSLEEVKRVAEETSAGLGYREHVTASSPG